jgi:hypothetical protein
LSGRITTKQQQRTYYFDNHDTYGIPKWSGLNNQTTHIFFFSLPYEFFFLLLYALPYEFFFLLLYEQVYKEE